MVFSWNNPQFNLGRISSQKNIPESKGPKAIPNRKWGPKKVRMWGTMVVNNPVWKRRHIETFPQKGKEKKIEHFKSHLVFLQKGESLSSWCLELCFFLDKFHVVSAISLWDLKWSIMELCISKRVGCLCVWWCFNVFLRQTQTSVNCQLWRTWHIGQFGPNTSSFDYHLTPNSRIDHCQICNPSLVPQDFGPARKS